MQIIKKMMTRMAKSTMVKNAELEDIPTFSYAELQTILSEAANVVNDSPVRAASLMEEDLVPLSINQLLLGRNSTQAVTYNSEGELVSLEGLIKKHRNVLTSWWKLWKEQSFGHILPFRRAIEARQHEDVKVGDICLLKYTTKVASYY